MGHSEKIKCSQLSNMSKLGCSLKEAYGESWSAGPKYYQAQPSAFQTIDPYGPNPRAENFTNNKKTENLQEKIKDLEALVNRITHKRQDTRAEHAEGFTNEPRKDIIQELYVMACSPLMKDRIDCLIKFVLCSLLVSNVLELLSINA
tara:strand:- start:948 stop:1388 length:441 start_codon:yes stop_codon:yes gene_type:complete